MGIYYCTNCGTYHDNDSVLCIENIKGDLVCHESEVEKTENADQRDWQGGNMKVEKVRLHIAVGQYQFIECDLPEINELDKLLEFAKEVKERELKERYDCQHLFVENYISKEGRPYRQCQNCGAMSFQEGRGETAKWSSFRHLIKNDKGGK